MKFDAAVRKQVRLELDGEARVRRKARRVTLCDDGPLPANAHERLPLAFLEAILMTLFYTGMRISECLGSSSAT